MSLNRILLYFQHLIHIYRLSTINLKSKGSNVNISKGFLFSYPENIVIGNDVYIGPHANIDSIGGIIIGSGTIIGPKLTVYTANHRFRHASAIPYDDVVLPGRVVIGDNVWIGGNVIIVPGVTISEGCIVGAGSVVTNNFSQFNVIGGNPARVIGTRDANHYTQLKQRKQIYFLLKSKGLMRPHIER